MSNYKSETKGPINLIPKTNYISTLTVANYLLTKQTIDQALNEDHEYVLNKNIEMRTGGTLNSFFATGNYKLNYKNNDEENSEPEKKRRKIIYNNGKAQEPDELINEVPGNIKFAKDIRDEKAKELVFSHVLDQNEQFRLLVNNLDEDQTNRFEVFHRTSLNKAQVKKLANTVLNQNISENIRVFLQSIGKVFAGEIIELAMQVRMKWLVGQLTINYNKRKRIGKQLKKFLKKLTMLVQKSNSTNSSTSLTAAEENNEDIEILNSNSEFNDSIDECESDSFYDDDEEEEPFVKAGNELLKYNKQVTQDIKTELVKHYNILAKRFNSLNMNIDKFLGSVEDSSSVTSESIGEGSTKNQPQNTKSKVINTSPLLSEHIREAWRLYQLQSDSLPSATWRQQGEGNGWMFR
ncbi:hypothetical protein TPHA_0D02460 [Tetrapisispora phaffii CBS 4417]|uniref:TAFII28-like protein domain-containing protein n=1 Tax=Tetrapisispora phaffii (strain ATCC 24235 / CBS 4417 / NBRC 1672 / NRRL Y-8282 / UCD 70-5) TaxID=1071381 RepID=G8BSR2_TETPH|nr:hypothetical protein TPHA_0D02460 [Tetrapisispora phaffii CBS 4417]CCE62883.1 hypothetical protein TPHA_0D02460 [Tetrapisispora phaffii CBS 4417]